MSVYKISHSKSKDSDRKERMLTVIFLITGLAKSGVFEDSDFCVQGFVLCFSWFFVIHMFSHLCGGENANVQLDGR